jgi:hypothetical protein
VAVRRDFASVKEHGKGFTNKNCYFYAPSKQPYAPKWEQEEEKKCTFNEAHSLLSSSIPTKFAFSISCEIR